MPKVYCNLTIVIYPKWLGWAGFLSMAVFRLPLLLSKGCSFWKLMGCGRNGTFDIVPDFRQWALLQVWSLESQVGSRSINKTSRFICGWWKFFHCEVLELDVVPIEGHGKWDGKECFGKLPKQTDYEGLIAVLTHATIRLSKLKEFWRNVSGVAHQMPGAKGFISSVGIGEIPWVKQGTFSIWESKDSMKNFAYQMREHAEVIKKTRKEDWYSEEMFVRFKIIRSEGSLKGINPLTGKL